MTKKTSRGKMERVPSRVALENLAKAKEEVKRWQTKLAYEQAKEAEEERMRVESRMKDCAYAVRQIGDVKHGDLVCFHPKPKAKKTFIIGRAYSFIDRDMEWAYVFLSKLELVFVSGKKADPTKEELKDEFDLAHCWRVRKADLAVVADVESAKLGALM